MVGKIIASSFGIAALVLILTRPSGFAQDVGAVSSGYATDFKAITLQS